MKIQSWRITLFAATLILAASVQIAQIKTTAFTLGQPLTIDGKIYTAQLEFLGGYGAVVFDSPEDMLRFARLPNVDISPKAEKVRTARSDVVVEVDHE
jgi:hypothetical protein